MMGRRRWKAAVASTAVLAGMSLLIWRWGAGGTPLPLIGVGLLTLGGLPAVLWLLLAGPARAGARRVPVTLWLGIAMLATGVGWLTLGRLNRVPVFGLPTPGRLEASGSEPPFRMRISPSPPQALKAAISRTLPGSQIAKTFELQSGAAPPTWEVLIAKRGRLIAEAVWFRSQLIYRHLSWNTAFSGNPLPPYGYAWTQLRQAVVLPYGTKTLGPYALPGYYVLVVPSLGQVYDLNPATGDVEGGVLGP